MLTRELIEQVVFANDKKRFTLSEAGNSIRAAQGHSTNQVCIEYEAVMPASLLYHGTATRFIDVIMVQRPGLIAGERHYVHLSADKETAQKVGLRHEEPVILTVNALRMFQQGFLFYVADNGVWLVEYVPAQFLSF